MPEEVRNLHSRCASGNPGLGGWACLIRMGADEKVLTGGDLAKTTQSVKLMSAIAGLSYLERPYKVRICSDSV